MALDDTNGSISNGTQMQQWSLTPGDSNQQWQISSLGNGYYTITNKTSGLNLDLTNGALADGTAIQQWQGSSGDFNQEWQFVPVASQAPTAGEVFKLVSAVSGSTIDVSGQSTANGAQIVEESNSGGLSQEWTVQSAGNGYYNLINNNSGLALDDTNGSTSDGTVMQQYQIVGTGNSNQQWMFTSLGNGYYSITNKTSGLVLDLTNGNTANGTPIQQWSYSSGDANQEWEMFPVS
jgi:hypothetical protein